MKRQVRWMALLGVIVSLFFWKILFTDQFSVFLTYDCATQYAWTHFAASSLREGILPLWDPYIQGGRSFIGELQTGVFYPPKLLLYVAPLNRSGLFPLRLLEYFYVFGHILGAFFMWLLAVEIGLNRFSAFVAAICFSLGGFVGTMSWPNILHSAIWLPLVLLFEIRAFRAQSPARSVLNAVVSGLFLAISILAGSIHAPIMEFLVVVSAGLYFATLRPEQQGYSRPRHAIRAIAIIAVIGLVGLAAAGIQILPSIEYGPLALRYRGAGLDPLPATQRPPYAEMTRQGFFPHSLLALALGGIPGGGKEFSPYCGMFPLILTIIGIWQNWRRECVKYLTVLGALAFLYTLVDFTPVHGLAYALVPGLWMAPQAERFVYLTHFAMSLLAAYGVQTLLSGDASVSHRVAPLLRILKWAAIAAGLSLAVPAFSGKMQANEWMYVSFLLLLCSCGLLRYLLGPYQAATASFLIAALILCDLAAFDWTVANKLEESKAGTNRLEELLGAGDVARFLKSQPGLFRVSVAAEFPPDIGDLYGIQTTGGLTATILKDLERGWRASGTGNLLNVRYFVNKERAEGLQLVYQDSPWKVYLNTAAMPRAWVVHHVEAEPPSPWLERRISAADFDPSRMAFLAEPLPARLLPLPEGGRDKVTIEQYRADRLELTVRSQAPGVLVLSEVYYPGWRATVNGQPTSISKVNGLLRGVVVPTGESKVAFWYAPRSVLIGAIISSLTFFGALAFAVVLKVKAGSGRARETALRVDQATPAD